MTVKARTYNLPPTPLIPNSPLPLIHYPGLVKDLVTSATFQTSDIFDLFAQNGWQSQWIASYGPDIQSHYHSTTHECMAVISGEGATIRFGVADSVGWKHDETGQRALGDRGTGEEGGLELTPGLGDVFIIPAGVSHKTFAPQPPTKDLTFHQPEDIKGGLAAKNQDPDSEARHREFFSKVPVEGNFMMMGAYPYGGVWDFAVGGEFEGREDKVWNVSKPEKDPVLGFSQDGLAALWSNV